MAKPARVNASPLYVGPETRQILCLKCYELLLDTAYGVEFTCNQLVDAVREHKCNG